MEINLAIPRYKFIEFYFIFTIPLDLIQFFQQGPLKFILTFQSSKQIAPKKFLLNSLILILRISQYHFQLWEV